MNEKFKSKVKSIYLLSIVYFVIAIVSWIVLTPTNWSWIIPIVSVITWLVVCYSVHNSKKVLYGQKDIDIDIEGAFPLSTALLCIFSVLCAATSDFLFVLAIIIVTILLYTRILFLFSNLIEKKSATLDLKEIDPENFPESEIVDFKWIIPLGESEVFWKKKLFDAMISEKISERKKEIAKKEAIVKTSKEFI